MVSSNHALVVSRELVYEMRASRRKCAFLIATISLGFFFLHYFLLPVRDFTNGGNYKDYRSIASRNLFSKTKRCPPNKDKRIFQALLTHWDTLANYHNIPYVIGLGSLLGQYRTQDIIPWDNDVDVLVDVKNFKILKRLGEKRNFKQGWDSNFHFVVQPEFDLKEETKRRRWSCYGKPVYFQVDRCSFVSPMARVIHGLKAIDIFPYIDNGSVVHDVDMKKYYDRTQFFPFRRCKFMNISTWCPNNIRRVLESAYDNDLQPECVCQDGVWIVKKNSFSLFQTKMLNYLKSFVTNAEA